MKQQHNKVFIVMMILVASFFVWYQSNQILNLDIAYLDQALSPSVGLVYIGLLLYIPVAFLVVLYLPTRLLFRLQLRWIPHTVQEQQNDYEDTYIPVPITINRTISYQVFRC